ncbi:IclR family transcriptional regulator [Palleronia aestuarii]|uniref:IclR family transcriptional regulator n=1 Tax=Palleronia aestuarii TaxID=568105 RepID=A0A2W7N4X9_9RHOB|nr:IclR family transcriptional regulator [Palleronia aestuarii]PZX15108.1 IclR family transcriptional regulator [Palleronia aestuarii]
MRTRSSPLEDGGSDPHEDGGRDRSSDRKFINSLSRGFDILRAFKPGAGPMGNQELSLATGIPKATVTRLTHTLSELGYLRYLKGEAKFEPTESILALGYAVLSNMTVRQIVREPMQKLAIAQDVTVALAARDRSSMIIVDAFNAGSLSSLHLEAGSRVPIATTAVGRAFLAGLDMEERAFFFDLLKAKLAAEDWAELKPRIDDAIAQVERRGFCYVEDDWHHGMRAVGSPLKSAAGQSLKSMLCGAPSFAVGRDKLEGELGPQLAHMCRQLSPMLR